jgi:hypothetical protein
MKTIWKLTGVLTFIAFAATTAQAATIFSTVGSLSSLDLTQTGRLSRNGIQQDWAGTELFPGVINTTTTFHYKTYVVNVGITPFIQIDFDSVPTNTFVSAYLTSYTPNSAGSPNFGFDQHWLGDAGISGNIFPTDPLFFNVIVPVNSNLVVVVNEVSPVGLGQSYGLTVEGFLDTEFTDPPPAVPEPSAALLIGTSLLPILLSARKRRADRATAKNPSAVCELNSSTSGATPRCRTAT